MRPRDVVSRTSSGKRESHFQPRTRSDEGDQEEEDRMHPPARDPLPRRRLAVVGNYLPRKCGIATFTTDLVTAVNDVAPALGISVIAMNDHGKRHAYPEQVRFQIDEDDISS